MWGGGGGALCLNAVNLWLRQKTSYTFNIQFTLSWEQRKEQDEKTPPTPSPLVANIGKASTCYTKEKND